MRPIKLKMIAFGPYNGTEIIDFNDLGNRNLFLVTGPTGAGKTTIFDAICYALYGVTSGTDRPEKSVKCQSAPLDLLCEIELEFQLHGKTYKLSRIPSQEKLKTRGEGTRIISPEATLEIEGKDLPETGAKHVTAYIESLIGLKVEQFRQIMMIPQGEFRKLLMAGSDERTGILKNIFRTNLYGSIQSKFKEEKLALESTIKQALNNRNNEILRMEVDETTEEGLEALSLIQADDKNSVLILEKVKALIEEDVASATTKAQEVAVIKNQLKEIVKEKTEADINNQRILKHNQLKENIERLEANTEQINAKRAQVIKLEKASKIMPLEATMENRSKEIEVKERSLENQKQLILLETHKYDQSEEKLKISNSKEVNTQIEALKKEGILIKTYVENVQAFSKVQEAISALDQEKTSLYLSYRSLQEEIEVEKEVEKKNTALIETHASVKELLLENEGAQEKQNRQIKLLNDFLSTESAYQNHLKEKVIIEDKLNTQESIVEEKEVFYKTKKKAYHLNQAALLAQDLKDGDSCPVCGSTEHVKLAELTENHVTEDALIMFEDELNKAIENKKVVELEAQSLKVKIQGLLDKLDDLLNQSIDQQLISEKCNSIDENKINVETSIRSLRESIETLKEKNLRLVENLELYNKAVEAQVLLSEKVNRMDSELVKLDTSIKKVDLDLASKNANKETLLKDIPEALRTTEALEHKLNSLRTQLVKMIKERDQAIAEHKQISDQLLQSKSKLDEMENDLESLSHKYDAEKSAFDQALVSESFNSLENYQSYKLDVDAMKSLQGIIQEHDQALHSKSNEVESLIKEITSFELIEILSFDAKIQETQEMETNITEILSRIQRRVEINKTQITQVTKITETIKEEEGAYRLLGKVADIVNGKNAKNITLERFILKTYLNDILEVSNQRLKLMTNHRYALRISEVLADGRSSGGLDLEVTDSYTGVPRSVKTLSGGESFKASLSMALGLAEVVQSYAGGIQLDTVFIDEGFGTLDQESLDSAINCLIELQDSGRLVGIISHVEELKERINTQLIIESNELGSSTRFMVN